MPRVLRDLSRIATPIASQLASLDADAILNAVTSSRAQKAAGFPRWISRLRRATEEIDAVGPFGLTVKFDRIQTLTTSEGILAWFGKRGDFYCVTTLFDGSARHPEYRTPLFPGLRKNDEFPLGDGGLLVGYIPNPTWFVDMHMVVMEDDAGFRELAETIDQARKDSGLAKALDALEGAGALEAIDAFTQLKKVKLAADLFGFMLVQALRANGDDHVATVHDFRLKQQGFGRGRHPNRGLRQFQRARVAYTIDLTPLPGDDGDGLLRRSPEETPKVISRSPMMPVLTR